MRVRATVSAIFAACVIASSAASAQRVLEVPSQYKTIQAAIWAFSGGVLSPPVPIPGLEGMLHLNRANLFAIPIGQFPMTGVLSFPVAFPSTVPRMSIPTQALIGLQLSNLDAVQVQ